MTKRAVIELSQASDLALVGGKAESLCRLINAGFNVPAGFVVTTASQMKKTPELEEEILDFFDKLGAQKVAVRSSATAEDGANDAWAGQFDTFLNVERSGLINAVKKCWASADSERAQAYAAEKGLQTGAVGVVVQAMVPAELSGVAFSVHPVTKDTKQMVIEAVSGLAEKLVSGTHTPDTYVVNKQSLELLEQYLVGHEQLLSKTQITEVVKQVLALEKLYKFGVDVEWSIAEDELFILQCRPITTLGVK